MRCRTNSPARIGRMPATMSIPSQEQPTDPIEKNACMFCLCETPRTIKYDGPCECKPYVHKRCLTTWFKKTPNECPLCRRDYDPLSEAEEMPLIVAGPVIERRVIIVFNRRIVFTFDHYTDNMKYLICIVILLYASAWLQSD